MSLVVYDSMRREKVPFQPLEPGKVRMYVCGVEAVVALADEVERATR